ncbi:MAG TPA: aldo/keto reductase, partial [Acidimicrobiales bacterium]|nr:aldo/keto reductase [Acidimicrobiales bacterium]
METRRIGQLAVSVVGVGCNNFGRKVDRDGVDRIVGTALDEGVTLFDTADIYSAGASESLLGEVLGSRRDSLVLATKFGGDMGEGMSSAPDYVRKAVDASLRRLQTDHIDLYQLHFHDGKTPIAETLGALDELVTAGKVREVGCSNFTPEMLEEASEVSYDGQARFACVQNHLSLLERADETAGLAAAEHLGMAYIP